MELKLQKNSIYVASHCMYLLLTVEQVRDAFINHFSEIAADITSYKSNPGCSCRHKVEKYLEQNKDEAYELLLSIFNSNPSLQENINNVNSMYEYIPVNGRVVTLDNTEEAWAQFVQKINAEKWSFMNFSTSSYGDKLRVYFI
jgi:hypothetical protein